MVPVSFQLNEVIIKAGENPADRIIRKVIENKDLNNPEKIPSFKYNCYNKTIYDFLPADTISAGIDSSRINKKLKGGHLLIMESVTERKFTAPDNSEEKIIGTKVSGFKRPSFASLSTDFQPFSFYKDIIKIFDINYLNPISNGSLKRYQFRLEDTLFQNSDTVFIISFKPLPGKNAEALKGVLYINTNKYAIQNVIAEPFEKGFVDIKIQQQYSFVDNKQWFPQQLNFELKMMKYPSKKMGTKANGKSYIQNVELGAVLNKKDFALEAVSMDPEASGRDELFWNKYRPEALSKREITTYQVIDSFGRKHNFEGILHLIEKINLNRIPVKFIDIDVPQTLVYNKFEGTRIGTGIYTNEKVFKPIVVGGFFGYGLKDLQWKYGGEFVWTINKNKELKIKAAYKNTLTETGGSGLNFFNGGLLDFRSAIASQMDRIQQNSVSIGFRALRYAEIDLALNHTIVTPQYNYAFQLNEAQQISNYTSSDITVHMRYAYKEKLITSFNQRMSMGSNYPVVFLAYTKGIRNFYNSGFDFNKAEARIEKSFFTKNIGETTFRIEGGFIDKPLPYGLLFTGEGSLDNSFPFPLKNSFQTAAPYEFLSDKYFNFHFAHDFGALLFKLNKFKPHISIHQSIGWGSLSDKESQQLIQFKTKEKGFYETRLRVDNIIKLNYLNIAYIGLGTGIYYRYGPYSYPNPADNLVLKFSLSFSTK